MGYIKEIQKNLRHTSRASFLSENALRDCIWYSATTQSYSQRTNIFDGTWLKAEKNNIFVALILKRFWDLNNIYVYSKLDDCDCFIDNIDSSLQKKFLCINVVDSCCLFESYIDKIRNSLAHGSFNFYDSKYVMLGQKHSKENSKANFVLSVQNDISSTIEELFDWFKKSLENVTEAKYECLMNELKLEKRGEYYYSNKINSYVVIDDNFKFDTGGKWVEQLKVYVNIYEDGQKYIIILAENLGNLSDEKLTFGDGNIRIISTNKIGEFFDIEGIEFKN